MPRRPGATRTRTGSRGGSCTASLSSEAKNRVRTSATQVHAPLYGSAACSGSSATLLHVPNLKTRRPAGHSIQRRRKRYVPRTLPMQAGPAAHGGKLDSSILSVATIPSAPSRTRARRGPPPTICESRVKQAEYALRLITSSGAYRLCGSFVRPWLSAQCCAVRPPHSSPSPAS